MNQQYASNFLNLLKGFPNDTFKIDNNSIKYNKIYIKKNFIQNINNITNKINHFHKEKWLFYMHLEECLEMPNIKEEEYNYI